MSDAYKRIQERLVAMGEPAHFTQAQGNLIAAVIAAEFDRLMVITGCERCDATGTITDGRGDLDECPDCRGDGR